ncbi:MAG: carbonic anhydrase [Candidatus Latescibacteria bacterium]|nr:carbonic anhydrase [Candidatus Latescibacterota bacterium]
MVVLSTVSSNKALQLLIAGNRLFVNDKATHPNSDKDRRKGVLRGQRPFAAILTCSDSRVPPEIIFDCGIGDLFVIRVAGNIIDTSVMGSIIYAVTHLFCPLVVVLGHEYCGAVTASLGSEENIRREPQSIRDIIETIRKNIPRTLAGTIDKNEAVISAAHENADAVVSQLQSDPVIASYIDGGKTLVVKAYYEMSTGKVIWE